MNKFLNRPLTPKRVKPTRSLAAEPEVASTVEKVAKKGEEKSSNEILHEAIRDDEAEMVYQILSKNRPFDQNLNKTMTKMRFCSDFTTSPQSSEFMFLSVDESVISEFVENQQLTIRGQPNEDAVLCTETATYPLKIVESATTMLLMKKMLTPPATNFGDAEFATEIIDGKCFAVGELCPRVEILQISKLKDLLHEHELFWDWRETEQNSKSVGYSMSDLLKTIQMSRKEIEIAIGDLPVVKMASGKYRYLSHKYRGELIGQLVEALDNDQISLTQAAKKEQFRAIWPVENVPNEVIEWYLMEKCDEEEDEKFKIRENELIRDLIVIVMYSKQKMTLKMFMELIGKILPFGLHVENPHFAGICEFEDAPNGEKSLVYLSREDLPDEVRDRLRHLFAFRKLWRMDDMRPYFGDLFKSRVAFDKYLVQNLEYTLDADNQLFYCGLK